MKKNHTLTSASSNQNIKEHQIKTVRLKLKRNLQLVVSVLAFLFYANTLHHSYALDDFAAIVDNPMTQSGLRALPAFFQSGFYSTYEYKDYNNYRPLTKLFLALEWQVAPNNPHFAHWVNVLLYSLTCGFVFNLLAVYFTKNLFVPFVAALVFAAHPLHTEVVANIKSVDEILAMFFFTASSLSLFNYIKTNSKKQLMFCAILFFSALLSKESAITFLIILIIQGLFFAKPSRTQLIILVTSLGVVALTYLLIRKNVLQAQAVNSTVIENYLIGIKDFISQKATAIFLTGVYVKLLILPIQLMCDGSLKQFPTVGLFDWQFILSAIVLIIMAVVAIGGWKKKSLFTFSILYFLITISVVSNIFILIGTCYGERLLFSPSLGYCLFAGALIQKVSQSKTLEIPSASLLSFFSFYAKSLSLVGVIILLFSVKTISRNVEWKDNLTLFSSDAVTATNSARIHYYLGNHLLQEKFLYGIKNNQERSNFVRKGVSEIKKAIEIYPQYAAAYNKLAMVTQQAGLLDDAKNYFIKAIACDSSNPDYYNNYGKLLFEQHKPQEAKLYFEKALLFKSDYLFALFNLAGIYKDEGDTLLNKHLFLISNSPSDSTTQFKNNAFTKYTTSILYLERVVKAAPSFALTYSVMSQVYEKLGDSTKATFYFNVSDSLNKLKYGNN